MERNNDIRIVDRLINICGWCGGTLPFHYPKYLDESCFYQGQ